MNHITRTGRKMFYFLPVVLIGCLSGTVSAKSTVETKLSVHGIILNDQQTAVPDATVYLLKAADSSLVRSELTDDKGAFNLEVVAAGDYFLQVSALGYEKYSTPVFYLDGPKMLGSLNLTSSNTELKEVTVTAGKPYLEREHGKLILNVENSIAATGSSAFEVIEKAPGVTVDNNDNISLRGRGGVMIQIDGKPTPMTGANLGNYLRGIPSGSIEKIEFITNPSAKYDAAGSAIINIKLKKDKRIGTNGNLSLTYGQGRYPKSNNGLSLNHRNKKINLFGNYSYAYREGFSNLLLDRDFYQENNFIGSYDQNNFLKMDFRNQIMRGGMDYSPDSKNTFGIIATRTSNKFNPMGDNVSYVYDENDQLASRFETTNKSQDHWFNTAANFNYKHTFDSTGTEWSTDLDYAHFGNTTEQNFSTFYYDLNNMQFLDPYLLYGNINGGLDIYAVKSDFVKPLGEKARLEAGVKSSYVVADNNLAFYDRSDGLEVYDSTKSNHYIYKENINAAYVNASRDWEKWSLQLGLRGEHTHVNGNQLVYNAVSDTNYFQLFPNVFVSRTINDNNSLEFNYSRRITRPSYDQLNPFKFFLDPTTYKEGNPYLKPETTHSWELTHVFKQKIYTTLNFARTTNSIIETISPAEDEIKLTIQTNKNLTTFDIYGLFVVLPLEVSKWWNSTNNINLYYGSYTGTIANTTLTNEGSLTWNFNTVNSFKLGKNFSAELNGNYRAKEIYAYESVYPLWSVSAGIQKKFHNNRATIRLNVNDIFYSNKVSADVHFTDYDETFKVIRDTRVAVLSLTYGFGNNSVGQARRRAGGAEDIKQRAGGGGANG